MQVDVESNKPTSVAGDDVAVDVEILAPVPLSLGASGELFVLPPIAEYAKLAKTRPEPAELEELNKLVNYPFCLAVISH